MKKTYGSMIFLLTIFTLQAQQSSIVLTDSLIRKPWKAKKGMQMVIATDSLVCLSTTSFIWYEKARQAILDHDPMCVEHYLELQSNLQHDIQLWNDSLSRQYYMLNALVKDFLKEKEGRLHEVQLQLNQVKDNLQYANTDLKMALHQVKSARRDPWLYGLLGAMLGAISVYFLMAN